MIYSSGNPLRPDMLTKNGELFTSGERLTTSDALQDRMHLLSTKSILCKQNRADLERLRVTQSFTKGLLSESSLWISTWLLTGTNKN